jgi:phosphatidylserine/phosphatidylglycerophosphate/cardiolipin synthase-like enzyme
MKNSNANKAAHPNYFAASPERLQTEAHLGSFIVGNGEDIYNAICPAIEAAREEVILITCFWARSSSLDLVSKSLRTLSDRVVARKEAKIPVYIGFSSLSALQKLFHTRSPRGTIYPPNQWNNKLWLPTMQELPGLDIQIKSIFLLPFSVMHPKFVVIDRREVFLPSCNVSWESWFEGCITLSGPIVEQFILFWKAFWIGEDVRWFDPDERPTQIADSWSPVLGTGDASARGAAYHAVDIRHISTTYAIFLPSPHHANPSFSLPWQRHRPPPSTPLNVFVLEAIIAASSSIYMQTPNVTSPPVLSAILQALRRGVDVHILTSEKLMILEQLVTAGTTTSRCIKKLVKLYKRAANSTRPSDEENMTIPVGKLKIEYYQPRSIQLPGEPVQSHLKLTVVDEEWTVLGSGNMDRASWYTSQEMGVAFKSSELARTVRETVNEKMTGRTKTAYDSNTVS